MTFFQIFCAFFCFSAFETYVRPKCKLPRFYLRLASVAADVLNGTCGKINSNILSFRCGLKTVSLFFF